MRRTVIELGHFAGEQHIRPVAPVVGLERVLLLLLCNALFIQSVSQRCSLITITTSGTANAG